MVPPVPGVSLLAYGTNRWGVNVACGDIDADGIDEIVTGPGPNEIFSSQVRGWNYDGDELTLVQSKSFLVFEEGDYVAGARIALGHPYQHPDYLP